MSALTSSLSYTDNLMQKAHFQIERRPRMLKDFLIDDRNSCSSSGFKSFPRRASPCTVGNLLERDGGKRESISSNKSTFLRSRSTAAAATTISALQKASEIVIKVVKSPSFLRRSLKRRFWRRNSAEERGMTVTVLRVKDVVRTRSSRDVIDEIMREKLSDSTEPSNAIATTGNNGSSWCGGHLIVDYVESWNGISDERSGEDAVKVVENFLPGVGDGKTKTNTTRSTTISDDAVGSKELRREEKEQQSPVSVLDSPFPENAEPFSFSIGEEDEDAEERAVQLLDQVKATRRVESSNANVDDVLLDFFKHHGSMKTSRRDQTANGEILKTAESWLNGEVEWCNETENEACIRDMERGGRWINFQEEEEEMTSDLGALVLEILVDELLDDLSLN